MNFVSSAAKPHRLSNIIRLLAWGLGLLYVFSRLIPCHPTIDYAVIIPLDNAWGQVLHVAFARHMQFGRDIVFTYGPWGFLARGYYPPTYLISVISWLSLSFVFVCAGWRMTRCFTNNQVLAWLWLIGFTSLASIPTGNDINNLLAAWGLLLLFLHFVVEEKAFSLLQAFLVFSLGWLGLVKFSGLMEGALLVALIALDNLLRHRRFPYIIPVWVAGVLIFWLLADQKLKWLWPFLRHSWEITSGYSDAMNDGDLFVPGPLVYLVIGAGLCGLSGILVRPPRRMTAALFISGICGILFLSFKQGYVRNDAMHEIVAVVTLMLIALACIAVAASREKRLMGIAVGLLCASGLFAAFAIGLNGPSESFCRQWVQTFTPYNLLSPVASLTSRNLQVDYEKSQAQIRGGIPLPSVQGGADLYSSSQDILLANGIDYRPRPVIQSYSAYTPELARMNSGWLQTDEAATNIFLALEGIDHRFPSQDDGLSWPELLTLYDLKGISSEYWTYLCLSRSPRPRSFHLEPLQETYVTLGKPFALPAAANELIWAEIDVKKTFAGKLLSFFYKPTILMADIVLADHSEKLDRIVPGTARAGFLLSPYISSNESFLELAKADETGLSGKVLVSVKLFESGTSGSSLCYQPRVNIRFYRLEFPPQEIQFQTPETLPSDTRIN